MTPDEIQKAAIEAASLAAVECYVDDWGSLGSGPEMEGHPYRSYYPVKFSELKPGAREALLAKFNDISRAATRAYDRAMLRPIEEAPERTRVLIYDGSLPFLAERQGDKWWVWHCISLGTFDLRPWKGHPPTHFRPLPKPGGV